MGWTIITHAQSSDSSPPFPAPNSVPSPLLHSSHEFGFFVLTARALFGTEAISSPCCVKKKKNIIELRIAGAQFDISSLHNF